jgi:hypothetical protein
MLLRAGAISAIAGAVFALIVNFFHPRASDPGNAEEFLQTVADSSAWMWIHAGLILALILITGGLAALYRSITSEPGASWARLGFVAALVGAAVWLGGAAVDGYALKPAADAWANAMEPEKSAALLVGSALWRVEVAAFFLSTFLYLGVAVTLYGLAVALSDAYPKWLGWVAVVAGVVSAVIGAVEFMQGPSVFWSNILFTLVALIATLWVLAMGVLMWRKGTA